MLSHLAFTCCKGDNRVTVIDPELTYISFMLLYGQIPRLGGSFGTTVQGDAKGCGGSLAACTTQFVYPLKPRSTLNSGAHDLYPALSGKST